MSTIVEKPRKRGKIRSYLGREYFICKRKLRYTFGKEHYAKIDKHKELQYSLIQHKSPLIRKLKDVDMYLQYNKVTNLKLAAACIDKIVIKPGETFSIWKLVGRPSARKGYKEGMVLHNGKVSAGIGGGLCQLGNLLYWMALHTPLTIKERWRHSYDVFPDVNRTIPFACGATLSYNYIDLVLYNGTDKTFAINLYLDEEYLNGEITCDTDLKTRYEIFETDHHFQSQWWGGYTRHNRIWKRIINIEDNSYEEVLVTENNAIMMYNPMIDR